MPSCYVPLVTYTTSFVTLYVANLKLYKWMLRAQSYR